MFLYLAWKDSGIFGISWLFIQQLMIFNSFYLCSTHVPVFQELSVRPHLHDSHNLWAVLVYLMRWKQLRSVTSLGSKAITCSFDVDCMSVWREPLLTSNTGALTCEKLIYSKVMISNGQTCVLRVFEWCTSHYQKLSCLAKSVILIKFSVCFSLSVALLYVTHTCLHCYCLPFLFYF